ncbi:circularly permuted type 2 ATP-grasp protein [Hirschia litorea]|uniref:Circularly permuted type 2 ATP-grasp protein n=1 Tax=Hirschia litorea TaxID=1199156 RepID=A0ABW2IID5_9PROT
MPNSTPSNDERHRNLLKNYKLINGALDEMMTLNGEVRPIWKNFITHLSQLSSEELDRRTKRGNQYLNDAGVFFRQYGDDGNQERDWPLSHIPVLIGEKEWQKICDGLHQRADLLEEVLKDIYGNNSLVSEGILPAQLIASNPEWLRPLVDSIPTNGNYLHFLAFEIGRGPAGNWWVLSDRAQAPSGAGFALENRVATSRVFSDFFETGNIQRLASFFREFKRALKTLNKTPENIIGIMTPGRFTDTYFEHAYIARYLGLALLEGEDMIVQNGKVMVRTIEGLKPVGVLWRRLDALFADPLELEQNSKLGTAGLVGSAKNGNINLVNALGSGLIETRALLAFMPRICKTIFKEDLKIPNVATWWCGPHKEREYVLKNAQNMIISPAMAPSVPFTSKQSQNQNNRYNYSNQAELETLLNFDGDQLVGQEAVTLSTTPTLKDGLLTPRPVTLRVFACRTANGWKFMPGGYARIGKHENASAIALQEGGSVSDVWVISDDKVDTQSLIKRPSNITKPYQTAALPSRAADNLLWLGRYAERAEIIIRLQRGYHLRIAEDANFERPLLKQINAHIQTFGATSASAPFTTIVSVVTSALNSASQLRDRFSDDGWLALKNLLNETNDLSKSPPFIGDDTARSMNLLLQKLTSFSGLVHENMYRYSGWRFLSIGRSLERAYETSSLLSKFAVPDAPLGSLEFALEIADSAMSHRRLYNLDTQLSSVIELVALDELSPRSILYHLSNIQQQVSFLPQHNQKDEVQKTSSILSQAYNDLKSHPDGTVSPKTLMDLRSKLGEFSMLLARQYFN